MCGSSTAAYAQGDERTVPMIMVRGSARVSRFFPLIQPKSRSAQLSPLPPATSAGVQSKFPSLTRSQLSFNSSELTGHDSDPATGGHEKKKKEKKKHHHERKHFYDEVKESSSVTPGLLLFSPFTTQK